MSKRNFENERTAVEAIDIKGVERFVLVIMDGASMDMRTSKPLTETKLRDHLRSRGMPDGDISATIMGARGRRNAQALEGQVRQATGAGAL